MKKIILYLLSLPLFLLSSCGDNNGFVEPFPDDQFKPIGFNIAADENVSRVLTGEEISAIDNTFNNPDKYNLKIRKRVTNIQQRSKLRAFSGIYKQGINVSDVQNEISETAEKYLAKESVKNSVRRLITKTSSNLLEKYNYGTVIKNETKTTYLHEEGRNIEVEPIPGEIYERIKVDNNSVTKTTQSSDPKYEYNPVVPQEEIDSEKYYNIPQSEYVTKADNHSGADAEGNAILISEKSIQYRTEEEKKEGKEGKGIFTLQDGRQYCAMENSIIVAKLTFHEEVKDPLTGEVEKAWYHVNKVRKYEEVVITSKEIQINTPVSYLKNPLPIMYSEQIHKFYINDLGTQTPSKNPLPKIDEEVNK